MGTNEKLFLRPTFEVSPIGVSYRKLQFFLFYTYKTLWLLSGTADLALHTFTLQPVSDWCHNLVFPLCGKSVEDLDRYFQISFFVHLAFYLFFDLNYFTPLRSK